MYDVSALRGTGDQNLKRFCGGSRRLPRVFVRVPTPRSPPTARGWPRGARSVPSTEREVQRSRKRAKNTSCPPESTECPVSATTCPPAETSCPPLQSVCPPKETYCPQNNTSCPKYWSLCPWAPRSVCFPPNPWGERVARGGREIRTLDPHPNLRRITTVASARAASGGSLRYSLRK